MLTVGSLFTGIGLLDLGLERAGLGPVVWQVEINPHARKVLAHHWPEVTRYEDVRSVGRSTLVPVDLICGGFPCEDTSSAGKGAGLAGARSGLWFEFHRIVSELLPKWVVVENVTSGASRWVDTVVAGLEQLGYACFPVPLSASDVGAPHRRARIFIVAAHAGVGELRIEQGRRSGTSGSGTSIARDEDAPDALLARREGPGPGAHESRCRPAPGAWWASEPDVGPLVHGRAGGLAGRARRAKIRLLGKAVVPQCAEVVGWVIRELAGLAQVSA